MNIGCAEMGPRLIHKTEKSYLSSACQAKNGDESARLSQGTPKYTYTCPHTQRRINMTQCLSMKMAGGGFRLPALPAHTQTHTCTVTLPPRLEERRAGGCSR